MNSVMAEKDACPTAPGSKPGAHLGPIGIFILTKYHKKTTSLKSEILLTGSEIN